MINTKLQNLLEEIGLSDKESVVYMSALEIGQCTILDLARHSGIKRSTVYEIIPFLENRQLIKRIKINKKFYYIAESPKAVAEILNQKRKKFDEALPEFMSLYNAPENKPKVFFYQGREEIERMYDDTLEAGLPLMNYTSIINLYDYLSKKWVKEYIRKRIAKKIPTRIIAVDSEESRAWVRTASRELRQIRIILNNNYTFAADVHIYGNKVIITTYKGGLFGLVIEDENIAQMQKMAFELMWSATCKIDG